MLRRWVCAAAVGLALALSLRAARAASIPALTRASWVWSDASDALCDLRKTFTLDAMPTNAAAFLTADNGYELYVHGSLVGSDVGAAADVWQSVERYGITSRLAKGRNVLGIHGIDLGGVRGVIAAIRVELKDKPPLELVTDETWRVTRDGKAVDYSHPEFIEGPEWRDARVVGPMGMTPWGELAWSPAGKRARPKISQTRLELAKPGKDFSWPERVAFLEVPSRKQCHLLRIVTVGEGGVSRAAGGPIPRSIPGPGNSFRPCQREPFRQ